mgnify:CR=1 FL=1
MRHRRLSHGKNFSTFISLFLLLYFASISLAPLTSSTNAFSAEIVVNFRYGEIVVPDDYPSIQSAINAADSGDEIYVKSGIYYENLIINKSISLIGEDLSLIHI